MNLRCFFSRQTVKNISKLNNGRAFYQHSSGYRCVAAAGTSTPPTFHPLGAYHSSSFVNCPNEHSIIDNQFRRWIRTSAQVSLDDSSSHLECESEDDATMNEFLSRFVWLMRKKLAAAYPDCDKDTVNAMLVIIVENVMSEMEKGGLQQMAGPGASMPSQDFSEDLWRTVWEVSNVVLQDMEKEKKKEKMKTFLQSEDVKEMYRFAGEVGIRGDMLRELRFKWARQKMEQSDFYESLERMRKEAEAEAAQNDSQEMVSGEGKELIGDNNVVEDKQKSVSLPKRHGKIKYKIYGLDLSNPKWAKVADKFHESSKFMWPQEPKPISHKCKLVTKKILSLKDEDDPAPLLGEWKDLLQPSRTDWVGLLDKLKKQNSHLYLKIAEYLLGEDSFQANERDYSKLIDALANQNRFEDAERILKNMNDKGILTDVITSTILVKMYCKAGNLNKAKEAFNNCKAHGFQPNMKLYNAMIMACVTANQPKDGETLLKEMELMGIKPPKEIYKAILQSFTHAGLADGADRICTFMQFTGGLSLDLESLALMVEAYARVGNPDRAMNYFTQITNLGFKPDDKCTASMIAAYEKRNLLDEALELLLRLEKDGFEPGVATYTVLVDWFSNLDLLEEAQQILDKIAEQGEAPPFKLHVSLCDMHIKSGAEKKALQALGVVESRIDELELEDFERLIGSLAAGGFMQDAQRVQGLMEARGFVLSDRLKVSLMASQALGKSKKTLRREN